MKHLESAQQQQVVEWSKWAYKAKPTQYPNLDLLHCSLNGVKLTATQSRVAKGKECLAVYLIYFYLCRVKTTTVCISK